MSRVVRALLASGLCIALAGVAYAWNPPAAPVATPSWYMNNLTGNIQADLDAYQDKGCTDGQNGVTGFIIMDFGAQFKNSSGVTGVLDQNGVFRTRANAGAVVRGYMQGFWECTSGYSQKLRVGVGTNNDGAWSAQSPVAAANDWAGLVNDMQTFLKTTNPNQRDMTVQITVWGANDLEDGWSEAAPVHSWVQQYQKATTLPFANYGDAGGCPLTGTTANSGDGICQIRHGDGSLGPLWHQSDEYAFSYGYSSAWGLPEIYNGNMAKQWQQISLWGHYHEGSKISFVGTMAQKGACNQRGGCAGMDFTANQAWQSLYSELNCNGAANCLTSQSPQYSTDISYRQ